MGDTEAMTATRKQEVGSIDAHILLALLLAYGPASPISLGWGVTSKQDL